MSHTVLGEMKYANQTGGRGRYGHVKLRVVVEDGVQGVVFVNRITDAAIPPRFIPSIESGIMTAIRGGALAQRGYADARIELVDGSYHDVDSSPVAFFLAASMALGEAARQLPPPPGDDPADSPGVRAPLVPGVPGLQQAAAAPEPDDPYV
jgi:elongation factor G